MTVAPIDNSADRDLNAVVTWRFDNASNLIGIIEMFKKFFTSAVDVPWTNFYKDLAIADGENAKPYALAMWGKLLGIERPELTYEDAPEKRTMSAKLYRKILIGRFRLANSNASLSSYVDYIRSVFGTSVSILWSRRIYIRVEWNKTGVLTEEEDEQKRAIEQFPDIVLAYPAGMKNADRTAGPVLGFDGQQVDTAKVFDYGEFTIDNFSSTTFSWDRKEYPV